MKRFTAVFLTFAFFVAMAAFPAPQASAAADYSTIKVKLTTNNATVLSMSVKGEYFINENGASFKGGTLTLRANLDGHVERVPFGRGRAVYGRVRFHYAGADEALCGLYVF